MQFLRGYLLFFVSVAISASVHAGEVFTEIFRSETLARDYKYTVYVPDRYKKDVKRYPVLYLLHGSGGNENDWLSQGGVRETMDALIARRQIQPMIVVMPGHPTAWWVDGAKEKGETTLIREVIPHAEGKYRIDGVRANRLIAGLSAGGYGTLNLVLKYPRMFAAAAILSPAIYDPVPPGHSSAIGNPQFQKEGKFEPELWKALNYVSIIEAYKKSGIIVPLYINSGDHDGLGIALQAAMLYEKLRLHQPDSVELRIVNGDHEWMLWRDTLPDALQFMSARIAGQR
jgi:enterochelin esterase-like enzyme